MTAVLRARSSRKAQPNRIRSVHFPAPSAGMNLSDPASRLGIDECLSIVNMFRSRYGLEFRPGFTEWCTGIGTPAEEVRSIIGLKGQAADGTDDKLFACTISGIWDVSASTETPSQVYTFPVQGPTSGIGSSTSFTTIAGHYLVYTDEANGYLAYSASSDTWTLVPQGIGAEEIKDANPRNFASVVEWKSRLFFVEKDSARSWYLPVGQLFGTVVEFDFGNKFQSGGHLINLWNWTIDGGSGVDDLLVAISGGGDLIVYQGTDPADPDTFSQKGKWFVGGVPSGRRIASTFGGDLNILSKMGLIPLSKLINGGELAQDDSYATRKISPLLNEKMRTRSHLTGWEVTMEPRTNTLLVNTPAWTGESREQYVLSLCGSNKGWSVWSGVPSTCFYTWNGETYFGTEDGRVCLLDGVYDNISIDGSIDDAYDVEASLLTSFQNFGNINQKRIQIIRPILRVNGSSPSMAQEARWDFDESAIVGTLTYGASTESLWGSAVWGVSLWGSGLKTKKRVSGSYGVGVHAAIMLRIAAHSEVILLGIDVGWDEGGLL